MKGIIDYIQSMHSKAKLEKYYPWVIPYLPLLYGQAPHALVPDDTGNAVHVDEFMTTDERFMKLNMTQFYADTVPDIYLPFCVYHRESCKSTAREFNLLKMTYSVLIVTVGCNVANGNLPLYQGKDD